MISHKNHTNIVQHYNEDAICKGCGKNFHGISWECQRCYEALYCDPDCIEKDIKNHIKECDILHIRGWLWWNVLDEKSDTTNSITTKAIDNPEIWYPTPSIWTNYIYPTKSELTEYILKIKNNPRNNMILSTYNNTKFSIQIYNIIISYLPLISDNKLNEFVNYYPNKLGFEYDKNKDNDNYDEYEEFKILDWGIGFLNRFLLSTKLINIEQAKKQI